jgi:hypothetical protein
VNNAAGVSSFFRKARKNWFPIALVVLIFFGYSVGKDRAERDNLKDSRNKVYYDSRSN